MSKFTDLLRDVAPTIAGVIGTAVGGPAGPLAALAVKTLSDKFLGHPNGTIEEVKVAVESLTPAQAADLHKAELEFRAKALENGFKLEELNVQRDKIAAEDRASARARDTEFLKAGRVNERANALAYIAIASLICFGMLGIAVSIWWPAATGAREICVLMIGYLLKEVSSVYNFEFGANKGEAVQRNAMVKWLDESGS